VEGCGKGEVRGALGEIAMKQLPVVYVRGFAGGTSGVNRQVDDPFYGFNDGSTHVRVDGDGKPQFYQFESPLLRLMVDEGYRLLVHGDQLAYLRAHEGKPIDQNSIWIYRFYDEAATTFGAPAHRSLLGRLVHGMEDHAAAPKGFNIETAAEKLYDFIMLIREKTSAEKVYLVAHSMGGLVARSMLQKASQNKDSDGNARTPARDLVERFFTYATPHGGIDFDLGALDWAMEAFGPAGADIFAPEKMHGYLDKDGTWGEKAPDGWDPQEIPPEILEPDRIFCLVGTDPADYGLSREVVGPKSDGLVKIDKAYVRNANRAFVHRSHSGRYGEVNSEEGYQNLRRFLFGAYQVKVDLRGLPEDGRQPGEVWQADLRLTVRGLPIVLHEQLAAHYCPIQLDQERKQHKDKADAPIPLTTVFLLGTGGADGRPNGEEQPLRARYSLTLRVFHVTEQHGGFLWKNHLEQVADWEDTLLVDVGRDDEDPVDAMRAWVAWKSAVQGPPERYNPITDGLANAADRKPCDFTSDGNALYCSVQLPDISSHIPILGDDTHLRLTVSRRD
jgi:pimeloyl-ACP methyl ester carboxylesterase